MGEYADYEIDRMIEDGYSPFSGREPKGRRDKRPPSSFYAGRSQGKQKPMGTTKTQIATEYPGKDTPAHMLQKYPEKIFDMGFFPKPVKKVASGWDFDSNEAPF